ncbi:23S rRNA (uracil(1939)-C(5))-methyltransferase RlmD [Peredibacter starrii]|uniref:23S rRNA (Uracil(1939)-C(5))-methyltransferase RlmD n=1 Tax=Peredibacter starrii TaxID=28202 RepID=A0AAX4HNY0_9BACT|nr:23S rRNA (uracil(1939)-C(5))-methyltransferase RlmD [Peredibacter starrii]WPU64972.1 23S rRNA (uracil(1939)-C(5))-methyltransferase RlmD [Peredibacter starrii]
MKNICGYFQQGICRSCDLMEVDYRDQLQMKEKLLSESLNDFSVSLLPSVASQEFSFRNKAKFVVTGTMENPVIGLWGEKNLDSGRELLNCPLHLDEINQALPAIKKFITEAKLVPYNIEAKKGELKGIILFYSPSSKESYLRFIMRSKEAVTRITKHHHALLNDLPHLKSLSVNIQPVPHALLEGDEEVFITQTSSVNHRLGTVDMKLGPRAFVQTNQAVAEKLYATAADWVKESGSKKFLELFCGQGAFSFFAAKNIEEGLGIEINADAVQQANLTAEKQNLPHLKFKSADAGKVASELMKFNPEVMLVNPPRRGLADATDLIINQRPNHLIYSSCNYETLAQDLKKLSPHYSVKRVQLFDMFPQTRHFETLVLLELKA